MKTEPVAGGILAIVVGRSTSEYLPTTLEAVAEGTRLPDRLHLVLLDEGDVDTAVLAARGVAVSIIREDASTTGEAFAAASGESTWTWLLHDDSAPGSRCLAELLRTTEASRTIAAAGPKQVGWDDPTDLLEVGIRATRSGRRVPELDPGEKDQGQFDTRDDVLAVGTAGMLLRTRALVDAGGFDPALGPFGDGLELSRRLRAAGHRVVVVPRAIVRHARQSYANTPQSFGRRRGSQMYTALQRAPRIIAPILFIVYMALTPFRSLARLAIKDTLRARGELWAAGSLLKRSGSVRAARERLRAATVTRSYRSLEATHGDVVESRSDIRKARGEAKRLRARPPALERRAAAERRARARTSATALAAITFVIGLAAFLPNLSAFGLTGGGLLPDDSSAGDLLAAATTTWLATGDGYPGHLEPLWILAIPFVWAAGPFGGSLTEVIFVFFMLAPMLAGIAAFRSAKLITGSPGLRFIVGALWAGAPPLLASLSAGQAGAVLLHIVLPLLVASLVRASRSAASSHLGSSAWWALAAGAAYPASLLAVAALVLVLAIVQRRLAWLWVPIPGAALAAPALWSMFKAVPASLAWLPGAAFAWSPGERWEILAGWPRGIDSFAGIVLTAAALLLLGALLSLARTGRALTVRFGWILVGVGGILTAFALMQTVGVDTNRLMEASAWPAPGLSLIWLGLAAAAAGGAHGLRRELSASDLSVRHVLIGFCALGVIAAPVTAAASWLTDIHTGSDAHAVADAPETRIPAVAAKSANSPEHGRTLVLEPTDSGFDVELWRDDGPQLTKQHRLPARGEALAETVSRLGENDFAERVADHAVTVILVPSDGAAVQELGALLDSTDSITRVTTSEIGTFWRVDAPSGRIMQGDTVLPSGAVEAVVEAEPGVLRLAERSNPRWVAVQDGIELERADDSWRVGWQVDEAGEVSISHEGGFSQWWVTLIRLLLIVGNITVSLPWRAR